jgi:hypothetical protein
MKTLEAMRIVLNVESVIVGIITAGALCSIMWGW